MENNLKNIFIASQSSASHAKLSRKLTGIFLKSDFNKFLNGFIHLVKYALIHGDKQIAIERTLNFVASFAVSPKYEKRNKENGGSKEEDDGEEVDHFLVSLFEFLIENHEANNKAVRFRVCQLINKILNSMGEEASIDDELYSTIYDTMLQRLLDKVPNVRVQAILALARLQEPHNKECPVIKAYLFHLSMDPNPEVRRAVLNNIAITFQTLPDIIARIRDVRELVRRQAYLILAQKVHIRSFTIAQRVLLLSEGLNDRSNLVRDTVKKKLLPSWLRLVNDSILELLKCLDVETSTESAELAMTSMFKDVPYPKLIEKFDILDNKKLIDYKTLSPESVLYWKCLTKHLRDEKADEYIEDILPDLTHFCQYVKDFVLMDAPEDEDPQETAMKLMEKDFISQQLIAMLTLFDMSDEVGRQSLTQLVHDLFIRQIVSEQCVKELGRVFTYLHQPAVRIGKLVDIISDLREPEEVPPPIQETPIVQIQSAPLREEEQRKKKIKLAQLRVKLNEVREELEDCVRTLNFEKAQELEVELKDLEEEHSVLATEISKTPQGTPALAPPPLSQVKLPEDDEEPKQLNDPQTITRCLLILCEVLSSSDIKTLNSLLRSLHDHLILPSLKSEDLNVRKYAVKSLALVCLLSKELAQQHLLLIVQISQMDVEEIQFVSLQGLFDLFMVYGIEEFSSAAGDMEQLQEAHDDQDVPNSQNPVARNMMSLLIKMLESGSSETRTLIVEGLCKLLLTWRISSPRLLTHLIILWYNPNTEEDNMLRQILGVFFPLYASTGSSNQEALCSAVLPTLKTLFSAPLRSPLADVDISDVANFLISITSPSVLSKQSADTINAHDTLVFSLCSEVLAFPDRDYIKVLVRSLTQLSLTPSNFASLRQIDVLCNKMKQVLSERSVLSYLERFHNTVKNFLTLAPSADDDTILVNETNNSQSVIDAPGSEPRGGDKTRRKRHLYTTITDMELISDADSETDKTPFKKSVLSISDTADERISVFDSEDEADREQNKKRRDENEAERKKEDKEDQSDFSMDNEIELSLTNDDTLKRENTGNRSSSDLFPSQESVKHTEDVCENTLKDDTQSGEESRVASSDDSSSSDSDAIPILKCSRAKVPRRKSTATPTDVTEKHEEPTALSLRKEKSRESGRPSSSSSSPSYHTARSSSSQSYASSTISSPIKKRQRRIPKPSPQVRESNTRRKPSGTPVSGCRVLRSASNTPEVPQSGLRTSKSTNKPFLSVPRGQYKSGSPNPSSESSSQAHSSSTSQSKPRTSSQSSSRSSKSDGVMPQVRTRSTQLSSQGSQNSSSSTSPNKRSRQHSESAKKATPGVQTRHRALIFESPSESSSSQGSVRRVSGRSTKGTRLSTFSP